MAQYAEEWGSSSPWCPESGSNELGKNVHDGICSELLMYHSACGLVLR